MCTLTKFTTEWYITDSSLVAEYVVAKQKTVIVLKEVP